MQIFASNNKNTVSTTKIKLQGNTATLMGFLLQIDKFEGPKFHSPLKKIRPIFLVLK